MRRVRSGTLDSVALLGLALVAVACIAATAARAQQSDPSALYYRGFELLDVEQKPAEARVLFERVADDTSASRFLQARALTGWIRCELQLGRNEPAADLYRHLTRDYADLPDAWIEVRGRVLLQGEATRFVSGMVTLRRGQFVDLDTLGVFDSLRTQRGAQSEIRYDGGKPLFLADRREADMAGIVPWLCDRPWFATESDQGREAWVQTLQEGAVLILRVIVRISGSGPPLNAVASPVCVGSPGKIAVHFQERGDFAQYRIERDDGATGQFTQIATVTRSPYVDDSAEEDRRYVYRIIGVTSEQDESVPVELQGSTHSRGQYHGRIEFTDDAGSMRAYDFVRRCLVETGGDLVLRGTYGGHGSAAFFDGYGCEVLAADRPGNERSSWQQEGRRHWQIPQGRRFMVPVRGGGVARCHWQAQPDGTVVNYTVYPDANAFPPAPELTLKAHPDRGAQLRIHLPAGAMVGEVRANSIVPADKQPRVLPVMRNVARDREAGAGELLQYSIAPSDALGRSLPGASIIWNSMPRAFVDGEITLASGEGYSFARQAKAPEDVADLAVTWDRRPRLIAQGGLTAFDELSNRKARRFAATTTDGWFDGLVSCDQDSLILKGSEHIIDSRPLAYQLFLIRLPHGGFAKVLAEPRPEEKSVTLRFVANLHEAVFRAAMPGTTTLGAGTFESGVLVR